MSFVTDHSLLISSIIPQNIHSTDAEIEEPLSHKMLEKMNELERKMDSFHQYPEDTNEVKAMEKDRISSLETHIVKLVEVISENSKTKPQPVQESQPSKSENDERLKHIEEQMKELIQMTAKKEPVLVKETPRKSLKRQLNALKALENEVCLINN